MSEESQKVLNPGGNIRSALSIIAELRDGSVVTEISAAVHDALAAVKQYNKPAEVTLTLTIKPFTNQSLVEPAVTITAVTAKKLPQEPPPATIYFIGDDGNANRNPARQEKLAFGVAPITNTGTGA